MRKNYKIKKHSCGFCKPHKLGLTKRWKPKELALARVLQDDLKQRELA